MQDYEEELMESQFEEFEDDYDDYEDFYGDEGVEM